MRNQKHIRIPDQTRMNLGLFLEHVQTGRVDLAAVQCIDEGGFVHDGAASSVDDDYAVFHLGEFGLADDVSGVGLESIIQ